MTNTFIAKDKIHKYRVSIEMTKLYPSTSLCLGNNNETVL